MKTNLIVLLGFVVLAGCGNSAVEPGAYRAVISLPGGELPFRLELAQSADGWDATLVNGEERVPVPQVQLSQEQLSLVLPAFNTRIEAGRKGSGFAGELTLVKRGGKTQVMPFAAEPGADYRFFPSPQPGSANVEGRWAVTFAEDNGDTSEAVAEFRQNGAVVTGTFLTPLGDYRFLAGEVHKGRLYLSTFDGSHAFLFEADITPDGKLDGDFWSGTAWHESWVATRDAAASLPDADAMTRFVGTEIEFAFPDTQGRLVSFSDPKFSGKVVVITLAGSWCPNCHDEAAFLAPFYERYRQQGLEIIALMFEHLDDFDDAARQVNAMRDKFDIGYTMLVAGSSDKDKASTTMSMLDRVYAYPTTIFVGRDGTVRRVHTGFSGPGTGEHYDRLAASFTATVEQLLAEK